MNIFTLFQPRIDEKHAKWLHLRIRPSTVPFLDTEKYKGKTRKYLVDGRWTLAFRDEQSCKEAETMVIEEMKLQQGAVGEQLKLLLEFDMPEDGLQHPCSSHETTSDDGSWLARTSSMIAHALLEVSSCAVFELWKHGGRKTPSLPSPTSKSVTLCTLHRQI